MDATQNEIFKGLKVKFPNPYLLLIWERKLLYLLGGVNMRKYVYDVEVFPNFFSATFIDCDTQEQHDFVVFENRDDRENLYIFLLSCELLIGFNNISYDDAILRYFVRKLKSKTLNEDLFEMSKRLVSDESREDQEIRELRYSKGLRWKQMDLMKIMAFDVLGISLKQIAINLKWHKIQDLPYPFDRHVSYEEVQIILDYNRNDVLITLELYKTLQPQINLRAEIGKIYNVDVTNASDSKMANVILEKIYVEETGIDIKDLKQRRTKHSVIKLDECIGNHIEFQTDTFKQLVNQILNTTVYVENNFAYSKTISFNGVEYELGIGGLHSKDGPAKFSTTSDHIIRDADVASYYPNIIINNNIKPAHLGDDFVRILKKITADRIEAKRCNDKVKADGLKITINSIFGKMGSDTFWLEDAKALLTVTISGQFYLLMLIEALGLAGIPNISANTDGIVCQIPVDKEDLYFEICKWWEGKTGFELEFTDYEMYIRSDVNNYITKKSDGKVKTRGRYSQEVELKKGYKYPIVPRCLYGYFINNKPVKETLQESRDVLDFCISQKSGKQFQMEYHKKNSVEVLQKNNRFYVSNTGGSLFKRNIEKNTISGLYVNNYVRILNDYDKTRPFEEFEINLDFYEKEVKKIIDAIEPPFTQFSLFGEKLENQVQTSIEEEQELENDHPNNSILFEKTQSTEGDIVIEDDQFSGGVPISQDALTPIDANQFWKGLEHNQAYFKDSRKKEEVQLSCPYCESSNIMVTEKWCFCSDCDGSWVLDGIVSYHELK